MVKKADQTVSNECKLCGKVCGRGRHSLAHHVKQEHKVQIQEYMKRHEAQTGRCLACGSNTTWSQRYLRWNTYCSRLCQTSHIALRPEETVRRSAQMRQTMAKLGREKATSKAKPQKGSVAGPKKKSK